MVWRHPKGSLVCVLFLSTIFVFLPLFKENRRKIVSRPNGRETGEMYDYAFSLCEAVKRFRMAANWQRAPCQKPFHDAPFSVELASMARASSAVKS